MPLKHSILVYVHFLKDLLCHISANKVITLAKCFGQKGLHYLFSIV